MASSKMPPKAVVRNADPGGLPRLVVRGPAPSSKMSPEQLSVSQVWFGPQNPLTPMVDRKQVVGRQFDYPVGQNIRIEPRDGERVTFEQLRGLADGYDLLRLVIETRKDQIEPLEWSVKPRGGRNGRPLMAKLDDPRLDQVEAFLRYPDREKPWGSWLRELLEAVFVLDAPAIYVRPNRGGGLWGLELIDGATIVPKLGPDGRRPIAPQVAYQQVLKGVPAVDYTSAELIYMPRNSRTHKIYGYSPVEQIVMTVNIALRRQVSQLNYFTEGNTPEALIGVPDTWSVSQVREFQEWWDSVLEGNLAARRHTRFVPGGMKYQPTRSEPLKDEFDEWLARVVCFAFSIPPTPFIKQMNRATADTAQEAALQEGLEPLLVWIKSLMDRILAQVLGWDDLEFCWNDLADVDPAVQAKIDEGDVGAGIRTRNEVRAARGLDPVEGGDILTVTAGQNVVTLDNILNPPEPPPAPAPMPIQHGPQPTGEPEASSGDMPAKPGAGNKKGKRASSPKSDKDDARSNAGGQNDDLTAKADAPAPGLYVCRKVEADTAAAILSWAQEAGFTNLMAAEELHVTTVYSRVPFPFDPVKTGLIVKGGARSVAPLGDEGAVVLKFTSDKLLARWKETIDAGATWDHPSYQPHITLSYEAGAVDLSKVAPFAGPIVLGPEVAEPLEPDTISKADLSREVGEKADRPFARPPWGRIKTRT